MKFIGKKNLIEEIALTLHMANNITCCHSNGYYDAAELIISRLQDLKLVSVEDDGDVMFGKDYYEPHSQDDEPEDDLINWAEIQEAELSAGTDIEFNSTQKVQVSDTTNDAM